jgi:outer membrane protein OmpA-like peptidoglycan-associated protein
MRLRYLILIVNPAINHLFSYIKGIHLENYSPFVSSLIWTPLFIFLPKTFFMSFNLLDSVKAIFNNEVVSKTASSLGESESGIQKALSGIVPVIFGGILSKSNSGEAASVLDMAKNAAGGGLMNTLKGLAMGDSNSIITRGMEMVRGIFGGHAGSVNKAIAGYSGIKESSANSLFAMAAPVALGKLGEHAEENNMNASGFSSFLESQKTYTINAMPSGLNLGSIPGLSALGSWTGKASSTTSDLRQRTSSATDRSVSDARSGGTKWLLPLILIVLVALALWYFLGKGCNQQNSTSGTKDTITTITTTPVQTDTTTLNTIGRASTKVRLVNGTELNAYAGGVEEQLVNCLNDASCQAGKDKWFDFDNLNFEVGSATLTPESQDQIKNIVAILNAYPAARIKVGGYTDKTGNDASNKKLSQQRADAVVSAIKAAGGKAEQITGAEGYGSEFAKAAATATDEERKKDRRIALQLNGK